MAKKKAEPSWLIVALRAMFDLIASEHDGAPAPPPVVKAKWKALTDAWKALGDEVAAAVYRSTAAAWAGEHGRCPLSGSPGACAACACPVGRAA